MDDSSDEDDMILLGESSDENSTKADSDIEIGQHLDEDIVPDSDSDSAPETFSFSDVQEKRKQAHKLTAESVKQQKAELKRKRTDILLQNIKQREEKRKKIESKRLPDHVLEKLDDDFEEETSEDKIKDVQELLDIEDDVREDIIETSGNITFKCKVLPIEAKKPKYVSEQVSHFKNTMLYGNRIRREKSNRNAVLKKEKQRVKR